MIDEIKQILVSGAEAESGRGAQLAAAYATGVKVANDRLKLAEELIADGRSLDAIIEIDRQPALLDLCASLFFDGLEAWHNLCVERDWVVAGSVDRDGVERLMSLRAETLKHSSLVNEYRVSARKKDLRQCIWLLRKLRQVDPGNQGYEADLREFERKRVDQLRNELNAAIASQSQDRIQAGYNELRDDGWIVGIPPDLKAMADHAVKNLETRRATTELTKLVEQLGAAYSAMKIEDGIRLVGQIESLLSEHALVLSDEQSIQYREAKDWCREEEKRRAEELAFSAKLDDLRNSLERADAEASDNLLNELARYDRPIPDGLSERASVLVDNWQLNRERVRRRVNVLVISLLAVACVTGLVIWRNVQMKNRAIAVAEELVGYADKLDLESYERRINKIKAEEPGLLKRAEVSRLLNKGPEINRLIDEKRGRFNAVIGQIEQALGLEEVTSDIDALISEAETLSQSADEVAAVSDKAMEWSQFKSMRLAEFQNAWDAWAEEMNKWLKQLDKISASDTDARSSKLAEAKAHYDLHPKAPNSEYENLLTPYTLRIQRAEGLDQDVRNQLSAINGATTLIAYLDAMDVYTRAFPTDDMSGRMKSILASRAVYEAVVENIPTASVANPFWGGIVTRKTRSTASNASGWSEIRDAIVEWEQDERLVEIYEYRDFRNASSGARISYIQGKPAAKNNLLYEVMIYTPVTGSNSKDPEFRMQDFGRALFPGVVKMGYCAEVHKIIGAVRFATADDGLMVLLTETKSLMGNEALPSILRAYLGADLIDAIQRLLPEQSSASLDRIKNELSTVRDSIHWLCIGHPQYSVATAKANEAVSRASQEVNALLGSRDWVRVDRVAEARAPRLYAVAQLDGGGVRKIGTQAPRELWLLRRTNGVMRIHLFASAGADGKFKKIMDVQPGEPIFAPGGDQTTSEALDALRKLGVGLSVQTILSDNAWPVNGMSSK